MESIKRISTRGRGRGILALTSYEPLPRPSKGPKSRAIPQDTNGIGNGHVSKDIRTNVTIKKINNLQNLQNKNSDGPKLIAKYNFTGNPDKPGGFDELSITQREHLILLAKGHSASKNHLWWEVKNGNGKVGFVPANYCMELDAQPTALPWLDNKRTDEEKKAQAKDNEKNKENDGGVFGTPNVGAVKPVVRPYKSAYQENQAKPAAGQKRQYYCEICDKQLNGPAPYSSHMTSKAHREEEEYLKSCS